MPPPPPSFQLLFFLFSLIIQSTLLYCIFDIYYSSPLVQDAKNHKITTNVEQAPASRLVVFSADGLRARSFYQHYQQKAPFLHRLVQEGKCSFGVSKSHVPTESRPGHVAMMAGFYEDVSAVARGWKRNPFPFDSTIKQATHSYLWGSPDIISLLVDGVEGAVWESYGEEEEDFGRTNAELLDEWVFERVDAFLTQNASKAREVEGPRAIFFLHLLGLDTNGHGHKPESKRYLDNIHTVDEGVKRTMALFEERFKDRRTAYLFTSDHGMTDWGSHGAGTDDETHTPFILWGSGVKSSRQHQTINQIDLAPIQSSLLGVPIPANSLGVLQAQMLDTSSQYKFQASYANLRQMVEHYSIKRSERLRNSLPYLFTDCPDLPLSSLNNVEEEIKRLAAAGRFDAAAAASLIWVPKVREALLYFHRYQRQSQGIAILSLFIGWNALIYVMATRIHQLRSSSASIFLPNRYFLVVIALAFSLLWLQQLVWTNYLYFLLPIYILSLLVNILSKDIQVAVRRLWSLDVNGLIVKGANAFADTAWLALAWTSIAALLISCCVTVFFLRWTLSVMFISMAPLPLLPPFRLKSMDKWNFAWLFFSVLLAIFPLLETVGRNQSVFLVTVAPILYGLLLRLYAKTSAGRMEGMFKGISWLHFGVAAIAYLSASAKGVKALQWPIRVISWASLPLSFALPLKVLSIDTPSLPDRLVLWNSSLFLPYALMSLAYESLFLVILACFLFTYVRLEHSHLDDSEFIGQAVGITSGRKVDRAKGAKAKGGISLANWRRAACLVVFTEMAFFGTGNIASLNSFNTDSLRNFLTVFSPFSMAALLLWKIAIPFLQLGIAFAVSFDQQYQEGTSLSAPMIIITNSMAAVFFFCLKDEGSWLEIGLSISNYVISLLSAAFVFLLLQVAGWLLSLSQQRPISVTKHNQ